MIQEIELKKNNLVKDKDGNIIKVESIGFNGINIGFDNMDCSGFSCDYKLEDVFGIELSEEILLKCGFEKRPESLNFVYYGFGTNPVTYDWMICLKYFKDENRFFFLNGHHTIKYLHQLQNLYWCLCGEELETNL